MQLPDVFGLLFPNVWTVISQLCATAVLFFLMYKLAYKPVKKMIQKRADYIEQTVRDADEAKAKALQNSTESEERVIASKKEAAEIIAAAKVTAENNRKEMVEATQLEINKMKEMAEEDIARSKEEAKEEIRQEMVSVALEASKEVLKREVNEKDNARLVMDFIKDMDK